MTKVVEKNEDGTLTEEQAERFTLGVAEIVRATMGRVSEMTPEQIIDVTRNRTESEHLLPVVQDVFQIIVDADLPGAFNQYIGAYSSHVLEEVFNQVVEKINANERAIIQKEVGVEYNDISPKDVIEYLEKGKEEVVE